MQNATPSLGHRKRLWKCENKHANALEQCLAMAYLLQQVSIPSD